MQSINLGGNTCIDATAVGWDGKTLKQRWVGRVTHDVNNVSIGSSGYASLGNVNSVFGVPSGATILSVFIRGWDGWSDYPATVCLSSDGNTVYVLAPPNTTMSRISIAMAYAYV